MFEVNMLWDLIPGADNQGYLAWAKKTVGTTLQQPGLVELRANRNLLGTPQIRVVTLWASGAEWAHYLESVWPPLEAEMHQFVANYQVELWGASPVIPEPLHPPK